MFHARTSEFEPRTLWLQFEKNVKRICTGEMLYGGWRWMVDCGWWIVVVVDKYALEAEVSHHTGGSRAESVSGRWQGNWPQAPNFWPLAPPSSQALKSQKKVKGPPRRGNPLDPGQLQLSKYITLSIVSIHITNSWLRETKISQGATKSSELEFKIKVLLTIGDSLSPISSFSSRDDEERECGISSSLYHSFH